MGGSATIHCNNCFSPVNSAFTIGHISQNLLTASSPPLHNMVLPSSCVRSTTSTNCEWTSFIRICYHYILFFCPYYYKVFRKLVVIWLLHVACKTSLLQRLGLPPQSLHDRTAMAEGWFRNPPENFSWCLTNPPLYVLGLWGCHNQKFIAEGNIIIT